MYCSNCGIQLDDGNLFCPNCGTPIAANGTNNINRGTTTRQNVNVNINPNMNRSMNPNINPNLNPGINPNYAQGYPNMPAQQTSNTKNVKIAAIIGCCLEILGIFLPFVNVSLFGVAIGRSFYQMAPVDFLIFLVIAFTGLAGILKEKYIASTLTGAIYGFLLYFDTYEYFQKLNESGSIASNGIGFYCMALGAVVMVVSGIIGFSMKKKEKQR